MQGSLAMTATGQPFSRAKPVTIDLHELLAEARDAAFALAAIEMFPS